jgi:hydroxypyruvate isomerase
MKNFTTRRSTLKKIAGGTALAGLYAMSGQIQAAENQMDDKLKGRINHSVCRWCYNDIPFEELCKKAKEIGLRSIELVGPNDWATLKKYGLHCSMPNGAEIGLDKGWSDKQYHEQLIQNYEKTIPLVAKAGLNNIITFSGNRRGMDDETGLNNCAEGLKKIMKTAEQNKVTVVMELLNSRVNHPDYFCDHTEWGVELCKRVASENFKLLYDIYHMQIMEGDVIATIKKHHQYIAHYHTGGVPGRNEIDDTQELNYPAIMKAILETGYKGWVAQEFIPKRDDKIASLKQGVMICDV